MHVNPLLPQGPANQSGHEEENVNFRFFHVENKNVTNISHQSWCNFFFFFFFRAAPVAYGSHTTATSDLIHISDMLQLVATLDP